MDQRVVRWWAQAEPGIRSAAAKVAPGQPLSAKLAWSLEAAGLAAPSIGQGAYSQPPEFAAALQRLKVLHLELRD